MLLLVEHGPKWLFLPHPTPLIACLQALLGLKPGTHLEVFLRLIVKGWTLSNHAPAVNDVEYSLDPKLMRSSPYLVHLSQYIRAYIVIPSRIL